MTIPTRTEAAKILKDLDPPEWLIAHSAAVADVAAFLADAFDKRGHAINASLVEAAALLMTWARRFPGTTRSGPWGTRTPARTS